MGQIQSSVSLGNVNDTEEFMRYSSILHSDTSGVINGGLEFDKNLNTQTVDVTFVVANVDVTVPQSLGRVPTGFLVANLSVASIIYLGSQGFDSSNIYLRASVACTCKVIIF